MFSKKDRYAFALAASLVAAAYALMMLDPTPNGFGIYTLWIAPPLLLTGLFLPVCGIIGLENLRSWSPEKRKGNVVKQVPAILVFLTAFVVYLFTLEPTASLWDCSEFIASAYKLEVPHTPGTPLSLLTGRLFSLLSLGDVSKVAWSVNLMSAIFSASAATLLYYIIFYLGETQSVSLGKHRRLMLTLSAMSGSLCLAFSDTFWFSAVEAETYGPACFFLLLLVWLILTGREFSEEKRTRRLILIFYLAGLAYCIHPMCLLALPLLPFTWYTWQRKITLRSTLIAVSAGMAIVFFISRFVAIGTFELAFSFDRFFVNRFDLPFYTGVFILSGTFVLLFIFIFKKYPGLKNYAWPFIFLLFGFIPYLMLFIRSNHNPPIDECNPENLATIKAYMNREGYPTSPLLFGPYFDARIQDVSVKKDVYFKGQEKYQIAGALPEYQYDSRQTFLPRMYSNDAAHIETYRSWTGLKPNEKPGFIDNMNFLLTYQIGHMYLRYLMWNFAGRDGDVQNAAWLRPWEKLSTSEFEKARNQYWMIPLLFGMLGALTQFRKDPKGFVAVAILFLINGIVLVLYLNSPPNEPRERDYIYVGSYIAFSMWIGLGLLALATVLSKMRGGVILSSLIGGAVPLWMMFQNYDDHDRSGRTFQVDNARNVLNSCAPNSILFTGGDNDTFPLWYLQEVEGVRTDVRVMVLSYMNTDWYINQLRKTYYDSGAFRLTLGENDYRQYGPNDVLYVDESIKTPIDLRQYITLLKAGHPALTKYSGKGEVYHILPSRTLSLPVDSKAGIMNAGRNHHGSDAMVLSVSGSYMGKNALAILDLVASNEWKRPVYFNFTSMNTLGLDLGPFLVQEGPVYRLTPDRHPGKEIAVDRKLSWENLVEKADYSNLKDPDVLFNYEDYQARIIVPIRQSFNALARAFLNEGDKDMAEKVLKTAMDELYPKHLRPSYTNLEAADMLLAISKPDMADTFSRAAFDYYYEQVRKDIRAGKKPDGLDAYILRSSAELLATTGKPEFEKELAKNGL